MSINVLTQAPMVQLSVTPQFMQSIHILQLSSAELTDYLHEQSVANPLLDITWHTSRTNKKRQSNLQISSKESQFDWLSNVRNPSETLEMVLLNQLEFTSISEKCKKMAGFLAGNLNDSGYLTIDLTEVCEKFHTNIEDVQQALQGVQALDPAGVGAQSLKECLHLQISRDPDADPLAYPIVCDYLEELARGKYNWIAEKLNTTVEDIKKARLYIHNLNPRPGLLYSSLTNIYILADAIIEGQQNGGFGIIMNESGIPKLSINTYYQQLCMEIENKEAKAFLRTHLQAANELFHALGERQKTLFKVIESIVMTQRGFFEKGISFLKPMNLRTVAEKLVLHESTISRTIQNKYVQTPHGLFPLHYFFCAGLSTDDGDTVSAESVKARIKLMINNEDKLNPLSDQRITEILVEAGIRISRRTVMKYREQLQYESSRLRHIL